MLTKNIFLTNRYFCYKIENCNLSSPTLINLYIKTYAYEINY